MAPGAEPAPLEKATVSQQASRTSPVSGREEWGVQAHPVAAPSGPESGDRGLSPHPLGTVNVEA